MSYSTKPGFVLGSDAAAAANAAELQRGSNVALTMLVCGFGGLFLLGALSDKYEQRKYRMRKGLVK